MKTLFDLKNQDSITLAGTTFKLLGIAGRGGSSIVYKAKKEGKSEDYFMIKEFYPYDLVIDREADGTVCFKNDIYCTVERRKARALRESEIVNELRHSNENGNGNNNPWFLYYSEPIPANNTIYTVIATESGEMLSEKINGGFFKQKKFAEICEYVLMILNALEPIHCKGFLHLDISPDNIHFSGLNVMRMIDYNSAFCLSDSSNEIITSFKIGYSAPELKKISETKPLELSFATDLYSVTSIFFELLKGRLPEEKDRIVRSRWYLTADEGILKGASELLVNDVNSFFRKNLSSRQEIRLQSVFEMKEEIEHFIKLSQEIHLVNNQKRPNLHFVCRETEIKVIGESLKNASYIILEGVGGIGKTELAKKYAWENRDKYDAIQFVTYNNSLLSTIALSLEFYNFDTAKTAEYKEKYGNYALKYMYRDKLNCLKEKHGDGRSLIIVDNYNVSADDKFAEFVSGEYKVIFTSRNKHNGNVLEVTEIKDENDLMVLFNEYYSPVKLQVDDNPIVQEIIKLVLGHTMTIMLIAATMQKSRKTSKEMLAHLLCSLDPELRTKIAVDKEGVSADVREQVMYQHIVNLFNMEQIQENENYAFIMTNMAIVPYTGIDIKTFYKWALSERYNGEDYSDLNTLIELRWIQEDEQSQRISLHPVISDVAYRQLKTDSAKCGVLIKNLIDYVKDCYGKTHIEQSAGVEILELASNRIKDETVTTANLISWFSHLNYSLANFQVAMKYIKTAAAIRENVLGKENPSTASAYHFIGSFFDAQGDYSMALEWHNKSLEINEKILGKEHKNTALTYNGIALTYNHMGEHSKSLEFYHKSLAIYEKVLGKDHTYIAILYNNVASSYLSQGDNSKALKWYEKAIAIHEKVSGMKNPDTAITYSCIAVVLNSKGEYSKALEFAQKALLILEEVVGKKHPETARIYCKIGNIYNSQRKDSKAIEWYYKALAIFNDVLGNEHPDTAKVYQSIANVYSNQNDYDKALELFQKASTIFENTLGDKHPSTASAYHNIACIYDCQKKYYEALEWYQKALVIFENIFGRDHPNTATTYNCIAGVLDSQGKHSEAFEWFQKTLKIREKVLGVEHPDTATTYNNLARVFANQGNYIKALEWYQKALTIREKVLGTKNPLTASTYNNIAIVYEEIGEQDKANEFRHKAERK